MSKSLEKQRLRKHRRNNRLAGRNERKLRRPAQHFGSQSDRLVADALHDLGTMRPPLDAVETRDAAGHLLQTDYHGYFANLQYAAFSADPATKLHALELAVAGMLIKLDSQAQQLNALQRLIKAQVDPDQEVGPKRLEFDVFELGNSVQGVLIDMRNGNRSELLKFALDQIAARRFATPTCVQEARMNAGYAVETRRLLLANFPKPGARDSVEASAEFVRDVLRKRIANIGASIDDLLGFEKSSQGRDAKSEVKRLRDFRSLALKSGEMAPTMKLLQEAADSRLVEAGLAFFLDRSIRLLDANLVAAPVPNASHEASVHPRTRNAVGQFSEEPDPGEW